MTFTALSTLLLPAQGARQRKILSSVIYFERMQMSEGALSVFCSRMFFGAGSSTVLLLS